MNRVLLFISIGLMSFGSAAFAETPVELGTRLYQEKKWAEAAQVLYQFTETHAKQDEDYFAAQYYFGLSLFDLKLYQASSYPIIKVVRSGSKKFRQPALEKLISISGHLKSQKMLDFAISDLRVDDLKKMSDDVYEYKLAEASYDKGQFDQAINYLAQALIKVPDHEAALSLLALSYLKKNNAPLAIESYQKLLNVYEKSAEADVLKKDYTTLNLGRAYFQQKNYPKAIETYSKISRVGHAYRESLKELAWSYLFIGQTTKAIGILESIHTPYYENYFEPESIFLRGILLNGICQFDEAEATIQVFSENYGRLIDILGAWNTQAIDAQQAISEIEFTLEILKAERKGKIKDKKVKISYNGRIPFKVTRTLLQDYRLENSYETLLQLKSENLLAVKSFSLDVNQLPVKTFLEKIYSGRLSYFENQVATVFNELLMKVQKDLNYYKDQLAFVSYEIKEARKKELKQKVIEENRDQDSTSAVESEKKKKEKKVGYQVWAFDGEFWRDELNTYEYSGKNLCTADEDNAGAKSEK